MNAVMQALKLCWWTLPVQRALLLTGAVFLLLLLAGWVPYLRWFWSCGVLLIMLPALAFGGPLWRAISAQRAAALAPGSRAKLLAAAFVVVVLCTLGVVAVEVLYKFLWASSSRGIWRDSWQTAALTFMVASTWAVGSFFAARSALASFAVFLAVNAGIIGAFAPRTREAAPTTPLLQEPMLQSSIFVALGWVAFGCWYLRRRRIARSAWLSRRGPDARFVTPVEAGGIRAGLKREAAMERLLLGGSSVLRLVLQWALVLMLLVGIQLVLVRDESDAELRTSLGLASLLLTLAAMMMVSDAVTSRLRALWLPAGLAPGALFALAERKLWKLAAGFGAIAAALLVMLWFTRSGQPQPALAYALASLLLAMMIPAYGALWGIAVWRWIVAVLLLLALRQSYWKHVVLDAAGNNWWWLATPVIATIALRMLARRRWLGQDMPRVFAAAGG